MAKLVLTVWALLTFLSPLVTAQEYGGRDLVTGIKTPEHEMVVGSISGGSVYMIWNLKSLMGEPLVSGKGIVIIPDQSSYSVTYKKQRYNVPADVFKKIKPITVKVKAQISPTLFVDFDLGAMNDIYFGASVLVPDLPDKDKYLSFNIPGSPAWGDLFYTDHLGLSSGYLSESQAKALFVKGLEVTPLGTYVEAEFDLNPVKRWIKRQSDRNAQSVVSITTKKGSVSSAERKEDPFNKFEKADEAASPEALEKIDADIKSFIIRRCGKYYTSVSLSSRFSLYVDHLGETKAEMKERERREAASARKRDQKIKKVKQDAWRELPEMQRKWQEKRAAIRAEARAYLIKKYGLEYSMESLNTLLEKNFTSLEGFESVYYINI